MRAYFYLRVSSKGQVEGDGPERQRLACEAFAKHHNIEVVSEFFDAYTGSGSAEHRPAFADLLKAPPVDCVIIERMDRLARDLMASEFLLRELRQRGVKLFVADQGQLVDTASDDVDPTRILIRQFMAALAQWEKSTLVKKLRAAQLRAAAEGRFCGRKPYGTAEAERDGLRQLVEWDRQGYNIDEISDMLNARGYPTRTGVAWSRFTVRGILARTNRGAKELGKKARAELASLLPPSDSQEGGNPNAASIK